MSENNAFHIDKHKRRIGFEKAAETYDAAAVLQREVADRLLQRLDYVNIKPERLLDLGSGTGYLSKDLLVRYPKTEIVAVDIAISMLKKTREHRKWLRRPKAVCAQAESLPFREDAFDLVISSLMLQWCENLEQVFTGFNRILSGNGLLAFTTFGPDTMKELRDSWAEVDGFEHTSRFIDMHDVGDAMMKAGFQQPVVDMEMITLTYPSVKSLMRDLKQIGATNAASDRNHGLTGKNAFKALEKAYEKFRTEDGLYPLSYEVLYGHAWAQADVGVVGGGKVIPINPVK